MVLKQKVFRVAQQVGSMNRLKSAIPVTPQQQQVVQGALKETGKNTATQQVPILTSLAAAAAGVGSVVGVAALVENYTASSVPAFDPKGQRFSQDNFGGRFARMLLACDPRLLLYSEADVRDCHQLLQSYETHKSNPEMDRALWEARRIYESAIHPDTGAWIPRPFRMAGYVPYNGPICVAMVASTSTVPLLAWSWINQSHNALVNFYNRNASAPMSNETLLKSYGTAVSSALIVAFGLSTFIQKRYPAETAKRLMKYVAFPSAVVASSLNCYIVRSPEIDTGIPLLNDQGQVVGESLKSKEAAARGVHSTTVSRALLQAPVYFLPPMLMAGIPFLKRAIMRHPAATVPLTTYLLLTSFGIGLPATVAIFPQIAEIDAQDAEAEFQALRNPETNLPYEKFYYNKGL